MHGYSYEVECNAEELARRGVIVVELEYRLGLFGYMATTALSEDSETGTSGNYGLMDAIKGLEWIQENIKNFGGDPERVTIAGQSAGAGMVSALLTSPLAKGLFSGAIMSSSFTPVSYTHLSVRVRSSACIFIMLYGWFPEWPKGTDCKSAGNAFGGSNPPSPIICRCGSIGRAADL